MSEKRREVLLDSHGEGRIDVLSDAVDYDEGWDGTRIMRAGADG